MKRVNLLHFAYYHDLVFDYIPKFCVSRGLLYLIPVSYLLAISNFERIIGSFIVI